MKLGTGGLSRAYSGGVVFALDSLPTDEKVDRILLDIVVDYAAVDGVQRMIAERALPIVEEEFGGSVRYRLAVPRTEADDITVRVGDLTRGAGRVERPDGTTTESG